MQQDPGSPQETEPALPLSVWVSPAEAQVSSGPPWGRGSGCSRPGSHGVQNKSSWKRSPFAPPYGHWADDPQTGEQLILQKKLSHCCKSSRAHNRFSNLGIWKGTENVQEIWLWRPVGFDYRTSTGLGKQTLRGYKQNIVPTRNQDKAAWPYKRLSQNCLWVSRSLWQRLGSTVACHGVRGIEYNSPGNCGMLA